LRQDLRAVKSFLFEQVAQVFIGKQAEQAAAPRRVAGKLEINESRSIVLAHQYVGLLREIVVDNAGAVQRSQQAARCFEVVRIVRFRQLHGLARKIAAREPVAFEVQQGWNAVKTLENRERTRLASHHVTCQPANPGACRADIADNRGFTSGGITPDFAKQVLFEQPRFSHCGRIQQRSTREALMADKSDDNSHDPSTDTERDLLDTTGEFFSVGTPLHAVRAGYVRRSADDVLYENLVAGRYAHIIAPDRSGKSSLVAATAARLENNGFKVATLDLEQIGVRDAGTDAGRWYYSVAYRLLRQLRIRVDLQSWWQDKSILSNRQRLLEFYSEIILRNIHERIVIFVDEIQCIGSLEFADQLLASIRAAHNARATDPEFARLTFVLLGECDPLSLIDVPEASPFNVTQPVTLGDFARSDLDLFCTELNLSPDKAAVALDRIFYWTGGQPYLAQKLARAVSRERVDENVADAVDRIATQQLAGRSALHSEPHMSHIHREVVNDKKRCEALLTLYGRIRKGIAVPADLGSELQRRLIAIGLIVIDEDGMLAVRNRLYGAVFTARWANENLPVHWRTPAIAAAILLVIVALPFWYTQLLPNSYVDVLTSDTVELQTASDAYVNLRSFPGHVDSADSLYRNFLQRRAALAADETQISAIAAMAAALPDAGRFPQELLAGFWDRRLQDARRREQRDDALIAAIEALVYSTPQRRVRAAMLVADDYPMLIASLAAAGRDNVVFNPDNLLLTEARSAEVTQWSLEPTGLQRREAWNITALEVTPLVRRVIVDREGVVNRVGLTINLSHARATDLRIKVIAPSGRAVEVTPGVERASSNEDLRIPAAQLREFIGEPLAGTWSVSIRDEELGLAGRLVGWNLNLNSQGLVEDFQRGLNISDPVERETNNVWFSDDGRYAVARAMQSDSARVWDLSFAKPVRAVAVNELEQLIGLSAGARLLVTATQDAIHLWNTTTGDRVATLPVGAASATSRLTADGTQLFVRRRSDIDTTFELWSLDTATISSTLNIAGTPALVSLDPTGSRIAVADYDRAVRIWSMRDGVLLTQIDLAAQPSEVSLSSGGEVLGVVLGTDGASLWRVDQPKEPLLEETGSGHWQLVFSASGARALIGRSETGFQVRNTADGRALGPPLGAAATPDTSSLLAFSTDEQIIVTSGGNSIARFWRAPTVPTHADSSVESAGLSVWPPSGDVVAVATPDAKKIVIGDQQGNVRVQSADTGRAEMRREAQSISYFGHHASITHLEVSRDGLLAASAAKDNTVRVWNLSDASPRQFIGSVPGAAIDRLVFSPSGTRLGILNGSNVEIIDASTGERLVRFDLNENHQGIAFAADDRLYLGGESGALRLLAQHSGENWGMQTLWQGGAAIRMLEASPKSRFLVLVDQNNLAQLFSLAEGRIGEMTLQLPAAVAEISFSPTGYRVLFRTNNWIHRASSAGTGLVWIDAILAPKSLRSARMVFGDSAANESAALGNLLYLPVAGDGQARLAKLSFVSAGGAGLFGSKEELLEEWRSKLALVPAQSPNE